MGTVKHALIFIAVTAAAVAHAQVDPARVVVRVNGKPIVGRDYYKRMEVQPGLGTVGPNRTFLRLYPGYLTLRWLIEEELMVQLAISKNLAPTTEHVESELKLRLEENAGQVRELLAFGFNQDDLKRRVLVDLSEFNILTEGVTITDFEVEKHYEDNILNYTLQKRYQIRIIRVKGDDAKKAVDEALAAGKSFEEVAREHSTDVSKFIGGSLGVVPESGLVGATRRAVANAGKGRTTEWVEQNDESAKFLIEDVMDQEVLPLDDKLKRGIRESLMQLRGSAKNNIPLMMVEFRKKAVLVFDNFPFAEQIIQHFSIGG